MGRENVRLQRKPLSSRSPLDAERQRCLNSNTEVDSSSAHLLFLYFGCPRRGPLIIDYGRAYLTLGDTGLDNGKIYF